MAEELAIKVIISSTREGRFGSNVGEWFYGITRQYEGIDPELVDLRAWPLPFFDESKSPASGEIAEEAEEWAKLIESVDGYVIVTPEYNHGYPAVLKNALDHLYKQWNNKRVAFVSYGGAAGGTRSVEQLRTVAIELQMAPIRETVAFPMYRNLFNEQGEPKDAELYENRARSLLDQLTWWATALKRACG